MRILFLADLPRDPHSGAAGTELQTVTALRALGHEIDEVWREDLPHRIAHWNLHYAFELPRAMRNAVARRLDRNYDAVHANQPHAWMAAKLWRESGQRGVFVHRSHGFELHVEEVRRRWYRDEDRSPLRRAMSGFLAPLLVRNSRQIARWSDGHIVSASLDADYLANRLRVPRERIAVIPQGVSNEYLGKAAPPLDGRRLKRVLHAAQFVAMKAPEVVAAAMRELARDAELSLTWICSRQHHDAVRALLGNAAARVELLDWLPTEELIEVYDRHGIFLFPSYFEGFGKVFLEAMSRGLAVVASDAGGMHDLIRSGGNGFLVPLGDAEAVVARVRELLADPERAARIGAAAAEEARAYTWERVARETASFYERLREAKR